MFVLVDYNSGVELGLASDEMKMRWSKRTKSEQFIEHTICCVKHRVIVKEKSK
jgi:hypothetical protein